MKFSIYLLRDDVNSLDGLIKAKYLQGTDKFTELKPTAKLPFTCKAYIQQNKTSAPRWAGFLGTHFDIGALNLQNSSSSFVILLKAANRVFAVTFGYGFNALEPARIERRFGLLVAVNQLAANEVRTLDTHTNDVISRQRRTHVSVASAVSEFGINPNLDWIKYVGGKPASPAFAKNISGSDSLGINCDCSLSQVAAKCDELLKLFESKAYQKKFPFVDYFQPLRDDEPVVTKLDAALLKAVSDRSADKIAITYPDLALTDNDQLAVYRIGSGYTKRDLEEVTLDDVYDFLLKDVGGVVDLDKAWIVGLDANDNAVSKRYPLRDYFVFEHLEGGETYLLSLGHWFRVSKDYIAEVRKRVAALPDMTAQLKLFPIKHGEDEGDYNQRLADNRGWLVMDKATFPVGGYDKIEVCDVLTDKKEYLCVKKMKSSATLSHLFAQGSVSASLLRRHAEYGKKVHDAAAGRWPAVKKQSDWTHNGTFVFAIPTEKKGKLADCMFFFSLVNLLEHAETVLLANYKVALCKIDYDPQSKAAATKPAKKPTKPKAAP